MLAQHHSFEQSKFIGGLGAEVEDRTRFSSLPKTGNTIILHQLMELVDRIELS